jgi:hypothetical protein
MRRPAAANSRSPWFDAAGVTNGNLLSIVKANRIAQLGCLWSERMDRPPSTSGAEQTFIEQMPAHIAVFDCEMRYVAVSQRFLSDMARLFATKVFTPAEVTGCLHWEIFPSMPQRWRDVHARVLMGEELTQEEDYLPHEGDRPEWARWSMKPWRTADGPIGGALRSAR